MLLRDMYATPSDGITVLLVPGPLEKGPWSVYILEYLITVKVFGAGAGIREWKKIQTCKKVLIN